MLGAMMLFDVLGHVAPRQPDVHIRVVRQFEATKQEHWMLLILDVVMPRCPAKILRLFNNLGDVTCGLFEMGLRAVCKCETTLVACPVRHNEVNTALCRFVGQHVSGV